MNEMCIRDRAGSDILKIIGRNGLSVILEVLTLAITITGVVMLFLLPFLLDYMLSGRYEDVYKRQLKTRRLHLSSKYAVPQKIKAVRNAVAHR